MGSHDYIVSYEVEDQKKVKKLWDRLVEEDRDESGGGAYAGNATTMHGKIRFHNLRCSTKDEASEIVLNKHDKWDGPVAVSYYLPVEKGQRDKNRVAKAVETYDKLWEKAKAILVKANAAFRERKSKMIGCSGCGSRLSKEHYLNNQTVHSILNSRDGTELNTFACSVCKAVLISDTVAKRVAAYEPKLKAASNAINGAREPKPGKKLGWCVGGWAAS